MVIFHGYVSLADGNPSLTGVDPYFCLLAPLAASIPKMLSGKTCRNMIYLGNAPSFPADFTFNPSTQGVDVGILKEMVTAYFTLEVLGCVFSGFGRWISDPCSRCNLNWCLEVPKDTDHQMPMAEFVELVMQPGP